MAGGDRDQVAFAAALAKGLALPHDILLSSFGGGEVGSRDGARGHEIPSTHEAAHGRGGFFSPPSALIDLTPLLHGKISSSADDDFIVAGQPHQRQDASSWGRSEAGGALLLITEGTSSSAAARRSDRSSVKVQKCGVLCHWYEGRTVARISEKTL